MKCPHCNKEINSKLIIAEGSRIMQARSVKKREYSTEQATKAVSIRWANYYKKMGKLKKNVPTTGSDTPKTSS
jgi:hypothetical protein